MGVNRYNPMKDLLSIQDRVNRLFEDIMEKETEEGTSLQKVWSPMVDIYETDEDFVVKAELPEVREEDIEIRVEDSMLVLSGERKFLRELDRNTFHRVERKYGHFRRSFRLPSSVDRDSVRASLRDGILTVSLRKRSDAGPRKIEIE